MSIIVHNPSTIALKQAIVAVPHGHFDVIDGQTNEPLSAVVLCHDDYDLNSANLKSCFMHIDLETKAWDFSVIKMQLNNSVNLEVK